jgi:PAS domain S-box-containing protein
MKESLAEALLEQSPDCQWITGSDGVFHRVSGPTQSLFGRRAPDLLGKKLTDQIDASAGELWRSRFDRVLAGETFRLREKRAKTIWYITMFPVRVDETIYAGGLAREITPLATAEQELRYAVLSALKSQEFDRQMVAKFLHDNVGQNLTALGLQLDLVRMDLETVAPECGKHISEIQQLLGSMMEEVRDYHYELNPSTVERNGLRIALDRLVARVRTRFTGTIRLNVDPSLKFDPKVATALYHIVQEALENAVQHSGCSAIEISVKSSRSGPLLEVKDDGRGFDPADPVSGGRGLGLLSMEHHAAQAGVNLSVASTPKKGTRVRAVAEGAQ